MAATALTYPACVTTSDGVTYQVEDAAHLKQLGLDSKKLELRRGGYFEESVPPKRDKRESVGRAQLKTQEETKRPKVTESTKKKVKKKAPSVDTDELGTFRDD